jgi:hypothetical protein
MLLAALLLGACPEAPLPGGVAFVRAMVSAERGHEAALARYTYDVHEVKDDLDASGQVTRRTFGRASAPNRAPRARRPAGSRQ